VRVRWGYLKSYKEVVKTPKRNLTSLSIFLTQRTFDYHLREVRPVTRKNVPTDLRDGCKGEPVLNRRSSEHQKAEQEVNYACMRKRLITPIQQDVPHLDEGWLDLDREAVVEVTSEEKDYPVESALVEKESRGWRAAESGTQTIRLIFDEPQRLKRIALVFEETQTQRTQAFVLRWSGDDGRSFREIVRQQWNFSPPNSLREVEEYRVELSGVTVLELVIVPDISRGTAHASLKSLRLS
jgi:hypothetical protein